MSQDKASLSGSLLMQSKVYEEIWKLQKELIHKFQTVKMAFFRLDADKDGYLFLNDFSSILMFNGFANDPIKHERLFHFIDFDQDGRINVEDWCWGFKKLGEKLEETKAKIAAEARSIRESKMRFSSASNYLSTSKSTSPASIKTTQILDSAKNSDKVVSVPHQNSYALLRYQNNPEIGTGSPDRGSSSGKKATSTYSSNPDFMSLLGMSDLKKNDKITRIGLETENKTNFESKTNGFNLSPVKKKEPTTEEKEQNDVLDYIKKLEERIKVLESQEKELPERFFSANQSERESKAASTNNFTFMGSMDSYRFNQRSLGDSPATNKLAFLKEPSPNKSSHKKYLSLQDNQLPTMASAERPSSTKASNNQKMFAEELETKRPQSLQGLLDPNQERTSFHSSKSNSNKDRKSHNQSPQFEKNQTSQHSTPEKNSKTSARDIDLVEMIIKASPLNQRLADLNKSVQTYRGASPSPLEQLDEVQRSTSKPNSTRKSPFPSNRNSPEIVISEYIEEKPSDESKDGRSYFGESARKDMPQITETEHEHTEETERHPNYETHIRETNQSPERSYRTGSPVDDKMFETYSSSKPTEYDDYFGYAGDYKKTLPKSYLSPENYFDKPEHELNTKVSSVMDTIHNKSSKNIHHVASPYSEYEDRELWNMFRKVESPLKQSTTSPRKSYISKTSTLRLGGYKEKIDRNTVNQVLSNRLTHGRTKDRYEGIVNSLNTFSIKVEDEKPFRLSERPSAMTRDIESVLHSEFSGPQRAYIISEITRLDVVDRQLKKVNRYLNDSYLYKK